MPVLIEIRLSKTTVDLSFDNRTPLRIRKKGPFSRVCHFLPQIQQNQTYPFSEVRRLYSKFSVRAPSVTKTEIPRFPNQRP